MANGAIIGSPSCSAALSARFSCLSRLVDVFDTHNAQNAQEEIDRVQVQGHGTYDRFIHTVSFHDLLGIVENEAGKEEDGEAGDGEIDVRVEWKEDLDQGHGEYPHQTGKEEWSEGGEVELA